MAFALWAQAMFVASESIWLVYVTHTSLLRAWEWNWNIKKIVQTFSMAEMHTLLIRTFSFALHFNRINKHWIEHFCTQTRRHSTHILHDVSFTLCLFFAINFFYLTNRRAIHFIHYIPFGCFFFSFVWTSEKADKVFLFSARPESSAASQITKHLQRGARNDARIASFEHGLKENCCFFLLATRQHGKDNTEIDAVNNNKIC